VNDTIIAMRAKEQHDNFMGKVFTHFSKPKARFIREATYGIQASGDTKLSYIVRAIEDDVAPPAAQNTLPKTTSPLQTLGEVPFRLQKMGKLQGETKKSGRICEFHRHSPHLLVTA